MSHFLDFFACAKRCTAFLISPIAMLASEVVHFRLSQNLVSAPLCEVALQSNRHTPDTTSMRPVVLTRMPTLISTAERA